MALYGAHFLHLAADFPNHSPWSDWTKYTDEGWYTNAALRLALTGHWYLPGDFNPAVAMPVWPLMAAGLFHFTGISIVALRALTVALFGIALFATTVLVRRYSSLSVALAVASLTVASPFLYGFGRLAILEPVLLCFFSVALLLADSLPRFARPASRTMGSLLLGLLLLLMLLTKATAVALIPAALYLLLRSHGFVDFRPRLQYGVLAIGSAALGWVAFRGAVLHSRYAADYAYLFTANHFPHPATWKGWLIDLRFSVQGLFTPNALLATAAVAVLCLSLFRPWRALWRNPLYSTSVLILAGITFFVFWHSYQAPRYYLFVPIPLAIIASLGTATIFSQVGRPARWLALAPMAVVLLLDTGRTLHAITHPEYTLLRAAEAIAWHIDHHPNAHRLLLSEAGDQITLFTGVPAMCDDFGTAPLPNELAGLQPGWFATWNTVDPAVLAQLHTQYHLQRASAYPVMDDPHRSALVLYRLVPLNQPELEVTAEAPGLVMYHRPQR